MNPVAGNEPTKSLHQNHLLKSQPSPKAAEIYRYCILEDEFDFAAVPAALDQLRADLRGYKFQPT